jgi:tyrosyl-tRNA synthetase
VTMTSPVSAADRGAAQAYADGCDHVETFDELAARLGRGRRLNVKLGLDPTTPDLHIGHAVVLRKLQQFVEGGHNVTLLIGDFTARIGDPTGRNTMRPPLTDEAIESNMVTYAKQAGKVLDMERVTLRYNSEWLGKLSFAQLIKLFAQTTVAQMLERNDFAQRYAAGTPISMHEFLYPVAQAYDSVALEADVELGGSDQLFNLLMGRPYQVHAGQIAQICMTVPLLEGIDGKKKMSKSTGNHIALTDAPNDQFGKLMRIPDEALPRYARLAAGWSQAATDALSAGLAAGTVVAMDEKKRIAQAVVAMRRARLLRTDDPARRTAHGDAGTAVRGRTDAGRHGRCGRVCRKQARGTAADRGGRRQNRRERRHRSESFLGCRRACRFTGRLP